ncbi:MAG: DUF4365 domain-containing protein [Pirellulales bacterium]|nr:DUF4365 domain-containing protein [Pirellulales bacterium]
MGINFLERQVLRRGHQLRRVPEPEYGTDAQMLHFSPETREIENGWIEFQVKATDEPRFVADGKSVACTVSMAHLHYWYWEVAHPFILVLYDVRKHRAFWVDVQAYVDEHPVEDRQTLTIHIPTRNKLTVAAIDRFRKMSLARNRSIG